MTANQINYWKAMWEDIRGRIANAEIERHNRALEAQNQYSLEETKRHNLETELLSGYQAKASLASASAAQTSAAAAYRQSQARFAELEQQKWVDTQVQSRQDLLASAQSRQIQAETKRTIAQTNLTNMQSISEGYKAGLIEAQTAQMNAQTLLTQAQTHTQTSQTVLNYTRAVSEGWDTVQGIIGLAKLVK